MNWIIKIYLLQKKLINFIKVYDDEHYFKNREIMEVIMVVWTMPAVDVACGGVSWRMEGDDEHYFDQNMPYFVIG